LPLAAAALLALGACRVHPGTLVPDHASVRTPLPSALAGPPGSFLVVGDARSFVWPRLLQDLVDDHTGTAGSVTVLNGAVPAAGILPWTEGESPVALRTLQADFLAPRAPLLGTAPPIRTALCWVSLAGLGDARGPVKSENDMLGAERGADALERLARALHESGIERVAFATPLYEPAAEPEAGLERVALERLLERGLPFVVAGPDLHRATRRYHPEAYEADGAPNEFGLKLIAEEWYRWLAGDEAREEAVEALYARDYDVAALEASFVRARGLTGP